MNTRKLKLDDLAVESFVTSQTPAIRGTVNGHNSEYQTGCVTQCPSGCLTQCDQSDCTYCVGTTGGNTNTPGTLAGATCGVVCQPTPDIE